MSLAWVTDGLMEVNTRSVSAKILVDAIGVYLCCSERWLSCFLFYLLGTSYTGSSSDKWRATQILGGITDRDLEQIGNAILRGCQNYLAMLLVPNFTHNRRDFVSGAALMGVASSVTWKTARSRFPVFSIAMFRAEHFHLCSTRSSVIASYVPWATAWFHTPSP